MKTRTCKGDVFERWTRLKTDEQLEHRCVTKLTFSCTGKTQLGLSNLTPINVGTDHHPRSIDIISRRVTYSVKLHTCQDSSLYYVLAESGNLTGNLYCATAAAVAALATTLHIADPLKAEVVRHISKMKLLTSFIHIITKKLYLFCIASKTASWWVWKHDFCLQEICSQIFPLIGSQTVAEGVPGLSILFCLVDVDVGLCGGRPGVSMQAAVLLLLVLSL